MKGLRLIKNTYNLQEFKLCRCVASWLSVVSWKLITDKRGTAD